MEDPTYQLFTANDIKHLLENQGDIKTSVAVANANLSAIKENFQNQCKNIDALQQSCSKLDEKYNALRGDVLKYTGIGIGAATVISKVVSLLALLTHFGLGGA